MRKILLLLFSISLVLIFSFIFKDSAHAQAENCEDIFLKSFCDEDTRCIWYQDPNTDYTNDPPGQCVEEGTVSVTPTPEGGGASGGSSSIQYRPSQLNITEDIESVTITFNNIADREWHVCANTDGCARAEDTINPNDDDDGDPNTLTVEVCAADNNTLKTDCDENDYFHGGEIYTFQLYENAVKDRKGPVARFFVNHYYPTVTVEKSGQQIQTVIDGLRHPTDDGNRNNYQVVLEGNDKFGNFYKDDECRNILENNTASFWGIDDTQDSFFNPGKYILKVNEQINEGGWVGATDECNGGFTFWHVEFEIDENRNIVFKDRGEEISGPFTCHGSDDEAMGTGADNTSASSKNCIKDPNRSDVEAMSELLEEFSDVPLLGLDCILSDPNEDGTRECVAINTAIGDIPTNVQGFVERLFTIVLSIAGIAALGLLIYGGYKYMTSQGDPEKVKGARETITSAIIGLLFIIFSLVILQVITGDILQIPDFNEPAIQTDELNEG